MPGGHGGAGACGRAVGRNHIRWKWAGGCLRDDWRTVQTDAWVLVGGRPGGANKVQWQRVGGCLQAGACGRKARTAYCGDGRAVACRRAAGRGGGACNIQANPATHNPNQRQLATPSRHLGNPSRKSATTKHIFATPTRSPAHSFRNPAITNTTLAMTNPAKPNTDPLNSAQSLHTPAGLQQTPAHILLPPA